MPRFSPATQSTVFRVGEHIETEVFDLKLCIDDWKPARIAKHVAQFANHLGGTLLIGAAESKGRRGAFKPVAAEAEAAMRQRISDAVEQRCVPVPLFEAVPIPHDGGFLLAVNVPSMIGGIVGVRMTVSKGEEGYGGDAFYFPIRVGISGGHITPATMHSHLIPELRRTLVLLRGIPCSPEAPAKIHFLGHSTPVAVADIDVEEPLNRVVFKNKAGTIVSTSALDRISTPWCDQDNVWHL